MKRRQFFKKCKTWWHEGFYVPVRSSMGFGLKDRHVTSKQKEIYEETFGKRILSDHEFDAWYDKVM